MFFSGEVGPCLLQRQCTRILCSWRSSFSLSLSSGIYSIVQVGESQSVGSLGTLSSEVCTCTMFVVVGAARVVHYTVLNTLCLASIIVLSCNGRPLGAQDLQVLKMAKS